MEMVPGAVAGRNARVLGWIFLGDICKDRYVVACRSMLERYVWERTYMRTTAGEASISWGMFGVCSEVCVRASWCSMSEVPCGSEILDTRNLLLPFEAVQCRRSRFLDGSLRWVSDGPEVWCARLVGSVTGQRTRVP